MPAAFPVVVLFLLAAVDQPKSEAPPAPVKKVLNKYLKAVRANDLKAMAALAGVPWLDRDRQVIRDRARLGKALRRVAVQLPRQKGKRSVEAFSYKKLRGDIEDEAERKLLDEVMGDGGWLVWVEKDGFPLSARTILIRVSGGKAVVSGGPLKENQLTPENRIPEVVDRLFDKADTFELYSLDPAERDQGGKAEEVKDGFHGWKVLGKVEVKGGDKRKRLGDALRRGAEDNFGMAAHCFIPRHGIRLQGGGKVIDLVICFECFSVQVFEDGKRTEDFLTTSGPRKEFDKVLKSAGVKRPRPAKK